MQGQAELNPGKGGLRQRRVFGKALNQGEIAVAQRRQLQSPRGDVQTRHPQIRLEQWSCSLTASAAEIEHR